LTVIGVARIGTLIYYAVSVCQAGLDCAKLHDYQQQRVCTLLNPRSDPLGPVFHASQSMIAVGVVGLPRLGCSWGPQTPLDLRPERTTDFISAVYAEEFGLYGGVAMLVLHGLLSARSLTIAMRASSQSGRLLAGALTMMVFIYVVVNVGMVTGILPVVGVPLPFMSYGGTALFTMGIACGILMSVSRHRGEQG